MTFQEVIHLHIVSAAKAVVEDYKKFPAASRDERDHRASMAPVFVKTNP